MKAIDFMVGRTVDYRMPATINVGFGNTCGSHGGTSLLETYVDAVSNYGRVVTTVGADDKGGRGGRISGTPTEGSPVDVKLSISPYETGSSVQL